LVFRQVAKDGMIWDDMGIVQKETPNHHSSEKNWPRSSPNHPTSMFLDHTWAYILPPWWFNNFF
jgi:hypothetical protein